MASQPTPPSVLREFCPLYYLLNAIPAKVPVHNRPKSLALSRDEAVDAVDDVAASVQVQRGFRSVLVYLTALDSSSDFLAVGSSIGMLYLYCRRLAHMNKYSVEVRASSVVRHVLSMCLHPSIQQGALFAEACMVSLT